MFDKTIAGELAGRQAMTGMQEVQQVFFEDFTALLSDTQQQELEQYPNELREQSRQRGNRQRR